MPGCRTQGGCQWKIPFESCKQPPTTLLSVVGCGATGTHWSILAGILSLPAYARPPSLLVIKLSVNEEVFGRETLPHWQHNLYRRKHHDQLLSRFLIHFPINVHHQRHELSRLHHPLLKRASPQPTCSSLGSPAWRRSQKRRPQPKCLPCSALTLRGAGAEFQGVTPLMFYRRRDNSSQPG